jgi:hypothetical protein
LHEDEIGRSGLDGSSVAGLKFPGDVRMADTIPRPDTPNRASISKETNGYIRALARRFHDRREVGFLCECGCMAIAIATLAEYDDQRGAWIDGHKPE